MRPQLFGIAIALAFTSAVHADPPAHGWFPRLTLPSETKGNVGYHVGGGNPFPHLAEPRTPDEGTWGWDYQGLHLPRRVMNGWWHGRKVQGGTGAYKTDGPRFQPGDGK